MFQRIRSLETHPYVRRCRAPSCATLTLILMLCHVITALTHVINDGAAPQKQLVEYELLHARLFDLCHWMALLCAMMRSFGVVGCGLLVWISPDAITAFACPQQQYNASKTAHDAYLDAQ